VTLDYSDEYKWWDNTETVTVSFRRYAGDVQIDLSSALRQQLNRRHAAFASIDIEGDETVWVLPEALLEGEEPKKGDEIEDSDDVTYTIVSAVRRGIGASITHWECVCRVQR
jgi:hypothetical protein